MLTSERIRNPELFNKIMTAEQASDMIKSGMTVGVSGFTPAGYPKAVALALAQAVRKGRQCQITLWSGASVGPEIDDELAAVGAVVRRAPYYAATNRHMRTAINRGEICYTDLHLSHLAQQLDYGFWGNLDVMIVEAVAITKNGDLVLGPGVGNTPMFLRHARQVIVEINTTQPLELEGMHDLVVLPAPPTRGSIPLYTAADRIGSPYATCGLDKISAIVESTLPDRVRDLSKPDAVSEQIATNLIEFLENEQRHGRIPRPMLPLQSGVGSIANAVLLGLLNSSWHELEMYSEILQDAVFTLIDHDKIKTASGCAFTPSPTVMQRFCQQPAVYRQAIVLRPLDISNHPEIIRRLGVIALNTPLEFDIYGQANSTHVLGTQMMNGIGGSGDYMRNGYLTIFTTESTAKAGAVSRIVPMVSHVDHTEHDTMVFITEYGVADVRGLCPRERAQVIINNCAHPDYRPLLKQYVKLAGERYGGHTPHDLELALGFHTNFMRTGTMQH